MRIGLAGVDGSHADDFLRHFNVETRHGGQRVTAIWGGAPSRHDELVALSGDVVPATSLDELIARVDAVIVGARHGGLHKHHALPSIAAGRPVFVDKPLANSLADATEIVDAAERAGVPLLSGSALRWQTETQMLKARLAALSGPLQLSAYGTWYPDNEYGGAIYYAIHTLELVHELVGPAWRDVRIERVPPAILPRSRGRGTTRSMVEGAAANADSEAETKSPGIRVHYRAGAHDVTMEFRPLGEFGTSAFGVNIDASGTTIEQPIPLGDDYMAPVCDRIAAMLDTGECPLSREKLLAPVALMNEIDRLLQ